MANRKCVAEPAFTGKETHETASDLARICDEKDSYRWILNSLSNGFIITDRDNRILFANTRMQQLSGYSPEELLGRTTYEFTPSNNWDPAHQRLQQRLAGGDQEFEVELIRKDGTTAWVRVVSTPFRDAAGDIQGGVGTITSIERQKSLERENAYLRYELRDTSAAAELIGPSSALARIREQIGMVAVTDANVLITGESGTGKELVARAIHRMSGRKNKPLVRVNCAAIPNELFESEFFGHVRGAFTGAIRDRAGRFDLADGGTLFLDEIGEIPLELQGKLLRVIQDGQFERIGEDRTRTVNVRVISATNRDLHSAAAEGSFRLDLYYRVAVFPIEIPPLRERTDDIVPLAEEFLRLAARKMGIIMPVLVAPHRNQLERYEWPGNVRELQNVIERAAILAAHGRFALHLDVAGRRGAAFRSRVPEPKPVGTLAALKDQEKEALAAALKKARGKIYGVNGAAALLGLKPTTLASKLTRLKLKRDEFIHG